MKSLLAITTIVFVSVSAASAGDAKTAKTDGAACASTCSSAKKECPKAAAALRQTLLTHKGAFLAKR